jgi:hypothetical protein
MANYEIAGIKIAFDYSQDEFFKGNIEKYQISADQIPMYHINSFISDQFDIPTIPLVLTYQTRYLYESESESVLIVYDDTFQFIKQKQTKRKDLSKIIIQLNPSYLNRIAEMEYIATGMAFFEIALHEKRLPLHASAIVYHHEAILFSAPSKTGKSTQANFWINALPEAYILNDDKPLIWVKAEKLVVSGTPWAGKTIKNDNQDVSLKTIVFLSQGIDNKINSFNKTEKLMKLLQNTYRPGNIESVDILMDLLQQIVNQVPMFGFEAKNDPSAFATIYHKLYMEESYENQK